MTGFEPRISEVGSCHSSNWATPLPNYNHFRALFCNAKNLLKTRNFYQSSHMTVKFVHDSKFCILKFESLFWKTGTTTTSTMIRLQMLPFQKSQNDIKTMQRHFIRRRFVASLFFHLCTVVSVTRWLNFSVQYWVIYNKSKLTMSKNFSKIG